MMIAALAWGAMLLTASAGTFAEEEPPPNIEAVRLSGPVFLLRSNTPVGNPSTVASIGPDGVFLADPNLLQVGEALQRTLSTLGGGPVRFVTATHFHGDHSEGFETFLPAATGIVPEAQRVRLASGEVVLGERPLKPEALPAITFEGRLTVHFNGDAIQLITLPHGHTDGDELVYFPGSGVLYVGDYLFLDRFPIVDLDHGGDLEGYLSNIEWILANFPAEVKVVPGHGTSPPNPPRAASMDDLRRNLQALRRSVGLIRERIAAGRSLEETIAEGLPPELAAMGEKPRYVSVEKWIELVYRYSTQ